MNNVIQLRPEAALVAIERYRKNTDNQGQEPPTGGGGEPPMELSERVIRVEEKLTGIDQRLGLVEGDLRALRADQRADFRATWVGLIGVALGLAGLLAKGFHWF